MIKTDSSDIRHTGPDPASHWYAARLTASPAIFLKRLAHDGIHSYRTKFAPGIVFLRCTAGWRFRRKVTPCVRFKVTPLSDFKMTPTFRFKVTPTFRLKVTPFEIS